MALSRFVIDENINSTGISFFAIFDGHGGDFAAVFAKDYLVQNLYNKIIETSNVLRGITPAATPTRNQNDESDCGGEKPSTSGEQQKEVEEEKPSSVQNASAQRRASFKKSYSTTDDCTGPKSNCNRDQDVFMNKLNSIVRTKDSFLKNNNNNNNVRPKTFEGKCYIDKGKINFGKMITDEVLAADYKLVETAKRTVSCLEVANLTGANYESF